MDCPRGVRGYLEASRRDFRAIRVSEKVCGQIKRVLRGGSWNNNPENLRASNRNRNEPDNRNNNIGFRCARDVE